MNKKIVTMAAAGLLSAMMIYPQTTAAFWPFTKSSDSGEVKGEQTEAKKPSLIQSLFSRPTPTPKEVVSTDSPEIDETVTDELVTKMVANKEITETQKKELQTRLAAIKAKRLELKTLQESLVKWLKTNGISKYVPQNNATSSGTTTSRPTKAPLNTVKPGVPTKTVTPRIPKQKIRLPRDWKLAVLNEIRVCPTKRPTTKETVVKLKKVMGEET